MGVDGIMVTVIQSNRLDDDEDDGKDVHIYQPFRSGRIWHKVNF